MTAREGERGEGAKMLVVRFPSGLTLTYHSANYINKANNRFDLFTDKPSEGGQWVATVVGEDGVVIESKSASRVENTMGELTDRRAFDHVMAFLRNYHSSQLRKLKAELGNFDARSGEWKTDESR